MFRLSQEEIQKAVRAALEEDVGSGDVTTLSTVPEEAQARALMVAREPLTLAGVEFAVQTFRALSPTLVVTKEMEDGQRAVRGQTILSVQGAARAILTAERVALNFVQRLSGVATISAQYVEAVRGTKAVILDTRKTTPGWRRFEKYAVTCGGATNHRTGLYDMVLIKDNHLAASSAEPGQVIQQAVRGARSKYPALKVEVEADTLAQVEQAAEARADFILCDNMDPAMLREAVRIVNGRAKTEASGGVNLWTVRGLAETGVDFISVGAMTHSARAVDIALDFPPATA
jgi:nicotinate-nucleotide pyrophosphorylase (carboxylating)